MASRNTTALRFSNCPSSARPWVPPSTNSTSVPHSLDCDASRASSSWPAPSSAMSVLPSASNKTGAVFLHGHEAVHRQHSCWPDTGASGPARSAESANPLVCIVVARLNQFRTGDDRSNQPVLVELHVIQHDVQVEKYEDDNQ